MDVLVFEIGGVRYAVPTSDVSEIVRAVTIVPLPKAPPIIEGIVNVRGRVVPVLDVRARFRLLPKAAAHTDHLVLARAGERLVAIRVDRTPDLVNVSGDDLEQVRTSVVGADYLLGVAKLPDGLVLIHDLRTFLEAAESAALDRALETVAALGGGP